MQAKRNIAARAARWSAAHKKTAIFGWLLFVVVAFQIGGNVGMKEMEPADQFAGESGRAEQALANAGFPEHAEETVLFSSQKYTVKDPQFAAAVRDVEKRVGKDATVYDMSSPYGPAAREQTRSGGHTAILRFSMRGDSKETAEKIASVMKTTSAAGRSHEGVKVEQVGSASFESVVEERVQADLGRATMLSLPITLLILLLTFGAVVAAGVPVLLAITSVLAAMGLVAVPSQIIPMEDTVSHVIMLVGMAVGVDYALFYFRRMREERENGHDNATALDIAAQTSGHAVLVSGLTVMVAMSGLFLMGEGTFLGMGIGTILVVAIAMIGSLTVLPAVLAGLGDNVDRGRIPFLKRRSRREGRGFWAGVTARVMKRPVVAMVLAGGLLVSLAIPGLMMKTKEAGFGELPSDIPAVQAYEHLQDEFPADQIPASVVVRADSVSKPEVQKAIGQLTARAEKSGVAVDEASVTVNPRRTLAQVDIPIAGDGTDEKSIGALEKIRDDIVPATVGQVPGVKADVTGMTAQSQDSSNQLSSKMPLVFAFVLTLAFVLLLFTFRSVVVPLKAIALNLLSVGAAYGVLVILFQWGVGESLLGFDSVGGIAPWLPPFLFVILFGLSMDYHVFILSRVRELVDRGMSTEDAVEEGIASTAGTVTSAALVMVAVFSIFASLSFLSMKEMGVGLAVAILLDATLVRAVLLPATMKLLGERNWYLPRGLRWLPNAQREEAPASA